MPLRSPSCLLLALLLVAQTCVAAIWLASLDGTCLDEHGKPLGDAVLHFTDSTNGRHFQSRTDADGKFFYIAAQPAVYTLQVVRNGKPPATFANVDIQWSSRPLVVEINLARGAVTVTRQTLLPEFFRQDEPTPELLAAGNGDQAAVTAINQQLTIARQLLEQGDWQGAIRALWNAIEIDPKRDLPWGLLGAAQCGSTLLRWWQIAARRLRP
jgi:hypothetical protein